MNQKSHEEIRRKNEKELHNKQELTKKPIASFMTLGCKVNQYETQALKEQFVAAGYEIVPPDQFADVYVINTCTVTGLSDRKSRQYVRRAKRINPQSITAVIGCYAQINPEEVCAMAGVDIVAGTNEKNHLLEYVRQYEQQREERIGASLRVDCHRIPTEELTEYADFGIITSMDSRTRAYVKIQEGCNRFCSYCVIPHARGPVRSRPVAEIIKEVKNLVNSGFKEIVLTGINTALYGMEADFITEDNWHDDGQMITEWPDKNDEVYGIEFIVNQINALPGEFRIRLSSLEPTVIDANCVRRLLRYEKLCPHLHLSLQSGSDRILTLMNRHYDVSQYREIVSVLKDHDQGFGISTDLIVGFPSETEKDFEDSVRMVKEIGFCKVHVFSYSKRKGTKAATMKEQVAPPVKAQRNKMLAAISEAESNNFFERNIGTIRTVLTERYDEKLNLLEGLSENYMKVYIPGSHELLNQFVKVEIKECYQDGVKGLMFS